MARFRSGLALFSLLLAACSSDDGGASTSSSSGAGGAQGSGGGGAACPEAVNNQGLCHAEEVGLTCPGTVSCLCDGEGKSVESSCVCEEGTTLDYQWRCGDECAAACGTGGGSGVGGGAQTGGAGGGAPIVGCTEFCDHLLSEPCLEQTERSCQSLCEYFQDPSCPAESQAFLQCATNAPIDCNKHSIVGCDAEADTYKACIQ